VYAAGLSGLTSFSVTGQSNKPENGDGNTAPYVITGAGLNLRTVQLRDERSGGGNGRIYIIT
jgi:hypothetical protein